MTPSNFYALIGLQQRVPNSPITSTSPEESNLMAGACNTILQSKYTTTIQNQNSQSKSTIKETTIKIYSLSIKITDTPLTAPAYQIFNVQRQRI